MYRFRRAAAALATVLAAGTWLTAVGPAPVSATGSSYVALGDSYSSGTGTRSYLSDGTSCQRSVHAYPSLIASSKGYALNFRACSGATTADVTNLQLSALGTGTAYASITVGGNDAGFAEVLTECAKPRVGQQLQRCHRPRPEHHQQPDPVASGHALLLDPRPCAAGAGGRCGIPAHLQR